MKSGLGMLKKSPMLKPFGGNKVKVTLIQAIEEVASLTPKDKQKVSGGKLYTMVHTRVEAFRKHFGEHSRIETEIIDCDLEVVRMKATVSVKLDGDWVVLGTGHAEEFRGQGIVNKTSALENCETGCIGRALASVGIHGGEFASAFEVDNAINNKQEAPDLTKGYTIIGSKGTATGTAPTSDTWFAMFQIMVKNPENPTCKKIYESNKDTVHRAFTEAKDKNLSSTVEGIAQLMTAYHDDFANEESS